MVKFRDMLFSAIGLGLLCIPWVSNAQDAVAVAGARFSPAANMELFAKDVQSAAGLSAGGQLLYEADTVKKSWNQYCGISRQASERGNFRLAVQEASKALFLGQREGQIHAQAYAARDLAIALSWAGDLDGGEQWAIQALEMSRRITINMNVDTEIRSEAVKVLGDVAMRRGQFTKALGHYEAALGTFPFLGGGARKDLARLNIASAQARLKQPQARTTFTDLSEAGDPLVRMSALRGLALVQMDTGEVGPAAATAARLQAVATESKEPYQALWALHLAARISAQQGLLEDASAAALRAVSAAESVRAVFRSSEIKAGFFNTIQEVFDQAMDILARTGRMKEAFEVSERSRARATLELLRNARSGEGSGIRADQISPVAELQKRLPSDTLLVSYHVLPGETLAWVVGHDNLQGLRLPIGRQALHQSVERFRKAIDSEQLTQIRPIAESLYKQLVAPLQLPPDKAVILVAHSSLHFLPFQALRGPAGWWIEERPLSYVLSANALSSGNPRLLSGLDQMIAFGNPDVGSRALDLPGSEDEVKALAILYPSTRVFTRKDASKSKVMEVAATAGVLHIAAHAFVDEIDPMHSYIKLADPLRKGELRAQEMQSMVLRQAQLVTLSACSSGMGRVAQGDEFWGFKRAVLATGTPRLIVSLWPVDDFATSTLMQAFYKAAAGMPSGQALRQAQLELIRNPATSQPHRWAPFVLVGDSM